MQARGCQDTNANLDQVKDVLPDGPSLLWTVWQVIATVRRESVSQKFSS